MQRNQTQRHAVTDAAYATIYQGRRLVREYKSGDRLVGQIECDDSAPPFTGFVRGFGKKKKGH